MGQWSPHPARDRRSEEVWPRGPQGVVAAVGRKAPWGTHGRASSQERSSGFKPSQQPAEAPAAGGGKPLPFYVADLVKLPGYAFSDPPWWSCFTPTGCFLVASGLMASDDLLSVRSCRPAPNPACALERHIAEACVERPHLHNGFSSSQGRGRARSDQQDSSSSGTSSSESATSTS